MRVSLRGTAAPAVPILPNHGSARTLLSHTSRLQALAGLLVLASTPGILLWAPQSAAREPVAPLKLAQAQGTTIEVVQTLIVEPATDAPLSLQLKTRGVLPPQSFVRIRGLPLAASLSEGHFVRPG